MHLQESSSGTCNTFQKQLFVFFHLIVPYELFSIHQHSCIECETLVSIKNGGRLEHLYMQDLSSGTSHQEKMPISLSEGSSYELSTIQIGGFHSR